MSRLVLALLASAAALAPAPRRAAKLTARDTATIAPPAIDAPAIVGGEKMPPPAFKRLGYLPDGAGAITADNTNLKVTEGVLGFAVPFKTKVGHVVGKAKSDLTSLDEVQAFTLQCVPGMSDMPEGYKSFGGKDFAQMLEVALATNSFYAASLTASDGGFELIAHDPASENKAYHLKAMETCVRAGPRVNWKFAVKPEGGLAIESYEVFVDGEKVEPTEDVQYYASSALYDLMFVSQSRHATIHVLHYILTNGLDEASRGFGRLKKWALEYNDHVNTKYDQVSNLLVGESGLVTSPTGLGGTAATQELMWEMLNSWGRCDSTTEFVNTWFDAPRAELEEAGLLVEFWKHLDLGAGFAVLTSASLEGKGEKLDKTNERLAAFCANCGDFDGSGVTNFKTWIQIMVATGLIHGSTLSMTRLAAVPEVMRWRAIDTPVWSPDDVAVMAGSLGTINGVQPEKHVMGSQKLVGGEAEDITFSKIQKVLETFDDQVTFLKNQYVKTIEKRSDFLDVGFLLTDYASDFYDGKQLTLCVYI